MRDFSRRRLKQVEKKAFFCYCNDGHMNFLFLQYFFSAAALLLCLAAIVVTAYKPYSEERQLLIVFEVSGIVTVFGHLAMVQSPHVSLDLLIFSIKLQYLGSCLAYGIFLIFVFRYFEIAIPKIFEWCLAAITVVFFAVIMTFDKHQLFYHTYYLKIVSGVTVLGKTYGIFHTLYKIFMMLCALTYGIILLTRFRMKNKMRMQRNILITLVALIPAISYVFENFVQCDPLKGTTIGIFVASAICLYLIVRQKVLNLSFRAWQLVIDSIDDAFMTLDKYHCLESYNASALKLFPNLKTVKLHQVLRDTLPELEEIFADIYPDEEIEHTDFVCKGKSYNPSIRTIFDSNENPAGFILQLRNVTAEREKERVLENYNKSLLSQVAMQTLRLEDLQDDMIRGFATLAEDHNLVMGKHVRRTSSYAWILATQLKYMHAHSDVIDDQWIERLRKVMPLHDIGKITISDLILNKPGKLTADEFETIKTHTTAGSDIIQMIMKNSDKKFLSAASNVARYHHEKWNGSGYPEKLSHTDIPLEARIASVADIFDTIVSKRAYKEPSLPEEAFHIIESESGRQFDPEIVRAFVKCEDEILQIYNDLKD